MPASISLCMIVKDEESRLPACLGCVADLVGEIIVVDTGSTDNTREVARHCGAEVHEFSWCDDFAAARNQSLHHATGDWIFWLDADDRIDEANRLHLRSLFANLPDENVAYLMHYVALNDGTPVGPVPWIMRSCFATCRRFVGSIGFTSKSCPPSRESAAESSRRMW